MTDNGDKETFDHVLEVITFPIYKVKMAIFYATNDSCSLKNSDTLYSYLPEPIGGLLCGQSGRLCKIDMNVPRCLTRNEEDFYNVTVTATVNPISSVLPSTEDASCDINCKLKIYSNMVGLVYKNAEMLQTQPILSKIDVPINFIPKGREATDVDPDITTKPPKIVTTCPSGYGVEQQRQRVCVLCPRHTYSEDDDAFCKVCPAGQYQPMPGSKSCLVCTSPLDDSMCLRMLYSDTRMFKLYVGVAFGMALLLILILAYWSSSGRDHTKDANRYEGSVKHRALSRRETDVENALLEPLLDKSDNPKRRNTPPKLPPPDF
ncbi:hypothetical protein NQ317_011325 [Molorchus minor]|uniref:Tyrosine-protein kinase ephrin type A/B receptor-like domain-containing protein n=1 Tax=Molorchus minor TaxID=1323400 RepID=A0ABQ9J4N7_9CUCU|nr:hypothetical protein NQ317_011325 [Molorchus minor]